MKNQNNQIDVTISLYWNIKMTAPAKVRQADITRALKGARAAGLIVLDFYVTLDGAIRVIIDTGAKNNKKGKTGWEDA